MTSYTLYYCEEGRIAEIAEMSCADDAAAVREAQQMFDGRALVLWCGERNVASWARQDGALAAARGAWRHLGLVGRSLSFLKKSGRDRPNKQPGSPLVRG